MQRSEQPYLSTRSNIRQWRHHLRWIARGTAVAIAFLLSSGARGMVSQATSGWSHIRSQQTLRGSWIQVPMPTTGVYDTLKSTENGVWLFGRQGAAFGDGAQWQIYPTDEWGVEAIVDVEVLAPNDIWVIRPFSVLRWDGSSWTASSVPLKPHEELIDSAFSSGDFGVLVGNEFHDSTATTSAISFVWDGSMWAREPQFDTADLEATSLLSKDDGWAYSMEGGLLRRVGESWQPTDTPGISSLRSSFYTSGSPSMDIAFSGSDDGWMMGGRQIWHWDGTQWHKSYKSRLDLYDMSVVGHERVWVSGGDWKTNDHILLMWDGTEWAEQTIDVSEPIVSVSANDMHTGWLLAFHSQAGKGPAALYRYRELEATEAPSIPTENLVPTTIAPEEVEKPATPMVSSTPMATQVVSTNTPNSTYTNQRGWITWVLLLVVVPTGVFVAILWRHRRPR